MFSPKGLNDEEDGKLFFEFLKNNNFPRIFIILRHKNDLFYLESSKYMKNIIILIF